MSEAGLWEEGGVREVHGLGVRFKTVDEIKARGYAFAFSYGSAALARAFAWLRGEQVDGVVFVACSDTAYFAHQG